MQINGRFEQKEPVAKKKIVKYKVRHVDTLLFLLQKRMQNSCCDASFVPIQIYNPTNSHEVFFFCFF